MGYKADEVIGVRLHNLRDDRHVTVQPFGTVLTRPQSGRLPWKRIDDNMILLAA